MKRALRFFPFAFFLFAFLSPPAGLFAFGKQEEPPKDPINPEWILCVTDLDISALPPARQIAGDAATRSLAGALAKLDFRFRGETESAYYRDYAWSKTRAEAAKALATKRNERDLLIFKGDPSWRYRKNLKTVDEAIAALEENLAAIDAEAPPVEGKPAFKLAESNLTGTYPKPPPPGGEYRFCGEQKADAFLAGSLSEYHGRIYLTIKLYTLYTRSYSFEDEALFSSDDLHGAMDEISSRLAAAVSDTLPAATLVRASPPEAMVLVDGAFAGRGETGIQNRVPGKVEITARADNHAPASASLELEAGELAEVFIDLTPLGYRAFEADIQDHPGSKVYIGSLYAGETPLALQLPKTDFAYISVETPGGEIGSAVYRDNELIRGRARFVEAEDPQGGARADFMATLPVSPEEKRVERARRGFYGAYGAFWFALPAALITAGIAGTYITANNYAVTTNAYSGDLNAYQGIYNKAKTSQYAQGVAYGVIGLSLGITFFQIFRYLYVSGGDATPLVQYPEPSFDFGQEQDPDAGPEASPPDPTD